MAEEPHARRHTCSPAQFTESTGCTMLRSTADLFPSSCVAGLFCGRREAPTSTQLTRLTRLMGDRWRKHRVHGPSGYQQTGYCCCYYWSHQRDLWVGLLARHFK
ncbi:hypothetical protein Cob_v006618 [Colletotrichum orbiculare MAFF 240422]|uniref:Uncharacterized protein n=1 Tax=Colletotrichum orbiculare (strain 104-T / ATCC 96160 / CBS 514.97 / LARS 414 / MAFF 240422) TaxID=1213857 RepID=A0A484FSI3_COLOR|nr:hypothetical protein Cob_v006618 [Colletotrichum orbiculare MAFF 240422]